MLGVVAGDNGHECGWDDAFYETEEEALREETLPGCYGGGEHGDCAPDYDDGTEDVSEGEALEGKGKGVKPAQHAEVEEGGCPAEAGG